MFFKFLPFFSLMHQDNEISHLITMLTGCTHLCLTDRGNTAIKLALQAAKEKGHTSVLLADEGGWMRYEEFSRKAGLAVAWLKTDHGLIDPSSLPEHPHACLLIQTIAGYFAHQDMKSIRDACDHTGIFLIEDISPSFSEQCYGDLVICSFGKWKIVNYGMGGFIGTTRDDIQLPAGINLPSLLGAAIKKAPERLASLYTLADEVKHDLQMYSVLHPSRKGVVIVVKYASDEEKRNIIKYCTEKGYGYELCPRQIRTMEKAVSIELKRGLS